MMPCVRYMYINYITYITSCTLHCKQMPTAIPWYQHVYTPVTCIAVVIRHTTDGSTLRPLMSAHCHVMALLP